MTRSSFSRLTFPAAVALTLVTIGCVIGAGFLAGVRPETVQSVAEELEERSETSDISQIEAIVGHEILMISNDALVEAFRVDHATMPLTNLWRGRPRGPPAA